MSADPTPPPTETPAAFWLGPVRVDLASYSAGEDSLSEQEVGLLRVLLTADGAPVSRLALYREVWGYRSEPLGRALDFAIRRLRAKLGDRTRGPVYLQTVRGVGFRLVGVRPDPKTGPAAAEAPLRGSNRDTRKPHGGLVSLAPRTPLIGRETEREDLLGLLAGKARLVNLVGPGGVGKTRLAVEVLTTLDRPVCVADLSNAEPGSSPLGALAEALGLRMEDPTADDLLSATLSQEVDVLLVDRCEHLADGLAPLLDHLLAHTSITVVATSKHRLGLDGEVLYDVAPLAQAEAVQLLVARCRALRRTIRLRETDPVAKRIAALVDGLPLALELVAARLRASSPLQVERRLREQFQHNEDAAFDPIQKTIAWSWGLLPHDLRQALSILHWLGSVVRPEHAEAVLTPLGDPHVLLEGLVDRSWLQPAATEPFRYRILTPAHRWLQTHAPDPQPDAAAAFLDLCGDSAVRRDFSAFSPALLARAQALAEHTQHTALLPLTEATLAFSAIRTKPSAAVALVETVQCLLPVPSLNLEIVLCWSLLAAEANTQAYERLLVVMNHPELTPKQQIRCHWGQARAFKNLGQLDRAIETAQAAAKAADVHGATAEAAGIHSLLIELFVHRGDLDDALAAGRTTLALADKMERTVGATGWSRNIWSSACQRLAPLYLMQGDVETARQLFANTSNRQREQGMSHRVFAALCNQALLEMMTGNAGAAEEHLQEAEALGDKVRLGYSAVQFYVVRSRTKHAQGDLRAARTSAEAAVNLARDKGSKALAVALQAPAWLDLFEGSLSSSAAEECWELTQAGGLRLLGCQAAGLCAWFAARRQDNERAHALAVDAERLADFSGRADEQVVALAGAALGYAAAGARDDADRALAKATAFADDLAHLAFTTDVVARARAERDRLAR